ncbi:peptide chain release factor N(5)-glutamine methyltransferase [Aquirhabdus sp.]|uniref:peptide chain release factor N(5)-glutamine methyltransferase n=1 Tax=Aquirhabdus sp. TaxID=2824160 RepID=UPI00396C71C4
MASLNLTIAQALQMTGQAVLQRELEQVLMHVLKQNHAFLRTHPERLLTTEQTDLFQEFQQQLVEGIPLAYVLGTQAFWTLNLKVTPATLIPRPDTEIVIVTSLELFNKDQKISVLDLGTGTGAIALSLASERPSWTITATDFSSDALAVAMDNAHSHNLDRVRFFQGNWFDALPDTLSYDLQGSNHRESFDLIVSNPPYIDPSDAHLANLTHEPLSALVADDSGLADLKIIIEQSLNRLSLNGWLVLEHGYDQGSTVRHLLVNAGFNNVRTVRDYGGNDRVSIGRKAGLPSC